MGRSGGGSFGGGGFGGGFSSGGGGFGGSFGGGNRGGGRSAGGGPSYGGGYHGGGSWLGGFLWGNLLGSSRGQTVVVQQPQGGGGGGAGSGGPGGPGSGGPSDGGMRDPNSKQSNNLGCLWIVLAVVVLAIIIAVFSGTSSVPASTVDRTPLPAGAAEVSEYYTDEDGDWIHTPAKLEEGLRHFYDETGVWPYVYILPNGYTTSSQQLTDMAQQLYGELFTDDAHFLLVFCDNNSGGYNCGYYGGQAARSVIDDEAVQILAAYLEINYDDMSLSEEQIFSNTFSQTADHIMSKTINPVIPIAIVAGVVIVVVIVALLIKRGRDAKKREADRMERILNTPLDQFGDKDLEELEKKYEDGAAASGAHNDGVNTAVADNKADKPE
ncbi:hypothetical protein [Adlercreutzia sp. ZJ304]|uniref:hypothetical protein n=1 Tax=Adlercreutzia sp. ZJ304 TaxID=2709791 RepID=UPI0013EB9BEE|nr:hypothetical protein [Adlercreutzia sp. ZJ304]